MKTDAPSVDRHRSTCQWLALHARQRPAALAFAHGDTYRALAFNVLKVMNALAAAGVQPGQVAGVETADRYLHLLILLAAEALSVTTISVVPAELRPPVNLGRLCDWIIVSSPVASSDPANVLSMTPDWISDVLAQPMEEWRLELLEHQPAPEAIARLVKSSGTTGMPKVMGMTHGVQQRLVQKYLLPVPPRMTRHLDYLCLYNFTVRASHVRALITLQLGGTIHLTGGDGLWDAIKAGTGNYVLFVTGDLTRFIQTAPGGRGPFDLQIDVIGAAVSRRLRQQIREKITNHMTVVYGSNECGCISVVDDDDIGTLFPNVDVETVNTRGEPVPLGQRGTIRVRSDTMTGGYVGAAELTRTAFINGWHDTNDIGFQPSEGKLVVLGRADGMLNIGGVKIAPTPIEQRLKAIDGIRDALVIGIDENLETSVLLVAVETGLDNGPAHLRRLLMPMLAEYGSGFQLIVLSAFPRTETGKIRQEEVKALFRRNAADEAP